MGVVDFATSGSGWEVIHRAATPDPLYPAKNFLASGADDADPRTAIVLQVLALENVSGAFRAFRAMGEWILGLALTAYWRRRLRNERFRFAAPDHVERVLNNAAANPSKSAKSVLQEVVHATSARRVMPQASLIWLDQKDT